MDGEKSVGRPASIFFLYGLYNNGTCFSENAVGDTQVVSNIETGMGTVRLYEDWMEQYFLKNRTSLYFGLYDLKSEFDVIMSLVKQACSSRAITGVEQISPSPARTASRSFRSHSWPCAVN